MKLGIPCYPKCSDNPAVPGDIYHEWFWHFNLIGGMDLTEIDA
jgi:hypothetical protein